MNIHLHVSVFFHNVIQYNVGQFVQPLGSWCREPSSYIMQCLQLLLKQCALNGTQVLSNNSDRCLAFQNCICIRHYFNCVTLIPIHWCFTCRHPINAQLDRLELNTVYPKNYAHGSRFLSNSFVCYGWFNPSSLHSFHWHLGNHTISLVPVTLSYRIWR